MQEGTWTMSEVRWRSLAGLETRVIAQNVRWISQKTMICMLRYGHDAIWFPTIVGMQEGA